MDDVDDLQRNALERTLERVRRYDQVHGEPSEGEQEDLMSLLNMVSGLWTSAEDSDTSSAGRDERELISLMLGGIHEAKGIVADLDEYLHDELKREGSFWDFIQSHQTFRTIYQSVDSQHNRRRLFAAIIACERVHSALEHFAEGEIYWGWVELLAASEKMGRCRPGDPAKEKAEAARILASQRRDRQEEADCKRLVLEDWQQNQSSYLVNGKPSRNRAAQAMANKLVPYPYSTVRNWLKEA